jgi:geranylgeranyl pyrophosphate synthase
MNPRRRKTSKVLLEILKEKSRESLQLARETILAERIESQKIREALEYYLSNWEVFTHPGLFSIACEAVDGNPEKWAKVGAAVAMLAAALDIHDDIIDKSDAKHGKPTVFGRFGPDLALLLGNAFFVEGFTFLGNSLVALPAKKSRKIFETVEKSMFEAGNAHALELDLKRKVHVTPEKYMNILKKKATSVESSMRLGAIVGDGTTSQVEELTKYGRILGILATLREEFIDVFEIQEIHQRLHNECLPLPVLYALQGENPRRIRKILSKEELTSEDVNKLLDVVFETKKVKELQSMMKGLVNDACKLTYKIRKKRIKDLLRQLVIVALEDL